MMKAKQFSASNRRPEILLPAARWLVAWNQTDRSTAIQVLKTFGRLNGHHNPFANLGRGRQAVHQLYHQVIVAPYGNHQTN
jgi:hypothetical protein